MKRPQMLCSHCSEPVEMTTFSGGCGTTWIHSDGYPECHLTFASPNIQRQEREMRETEK